MFYRVSLLAVTAALLTACASTPPAAPQRKPAQLRPQPVPSAPQQANADWHNLGVSPNGNILNEIDKLSVRRQGSVVTFRDKKTIFNMKKENFLSTPRHKYSINTWQIDCASRTFRLTSVTLFDENSRLVASYLYNDSQIKPMPVVQNSASYQQMLFVCGSTQPV